MATSGERDGGCFWRLPWFLVPQFLTRIPSWGTSNEILSEHASA